MAGKECTLKMPYCKHFTDDSGHCGAFTCKNSRAKCPVHRFGVLGRRG